MAFTSKGAVRIHWQEQGAGEPILLIMGHLYTGDMWYPLIPALADQHRVIWFDNRGTGRSGRSSTVTVPDMAADAKAVLDAASVGAANVFGVSMGGGIAMELALESPERVTSLLLGCTAIASWERPPKNLGAHLRYYLPRRLARSAMRDSLYGPACPDDGRAERDLKQIMRMRFSRRGVVAQSEAVRCYRLSLERAAQITAPTLVMHGTADQTVPFAMGEQIAEVLPNARFIGYEGAGHNYIVAAREKVTVDVLSFLAEAGRHVPVDPGR
ncbi:MAG: alpha/beta fold hydrolase [Acidimicrobiales bacterium]